MAKIRITIPTELLNRMLKKLKEDEMLNTENLKNLMEKENCEMPFPEVCKEDCEGCDRSRELPWDADLPFMVSPFAIERVIFNAPATIVMWADGTKTVVKAQDGDTFNKETGLAMCITKKVYGNTGYFNEIFKAHIPEYGKAKSDVYIEKDGKVTHLEPDGTQKVLAEDEAKEVQAKFGIGDKPKRTTKIDDGKIKALYDAGWDAEKIADEMNLAVSTVYKRLKEIRK